MRYSFETIFSDPIVTVLHTKTIYNYFRFALMFLTKEDAFLLRLEEKRVKYRK